MQIRLVRTYYSTLVPSSIRTLLELTFPAGLPLATPAPDPGRRLRREVLRYPK